MSVRTAAAIAVVAGVVTTLLPLSATTAAAAPATDGHTVLRTEMSTPVPNGSLTRGGATETFDLTVKNPSGKAVTYNPWMLVDPSGPSPLEENAIVFKVDAVDAPATKYAVGQQDGEWQGLFYPANASDAQKGFDIPANGKMTWKVTVGLGANYPTNDGDFKFTASSFNNSVAPGGADSHLFQVDPQIKPGELKTWFTEGNAETGGKERRAYLNLNYQATGEGTFDHALATTLALSHPGQEKADFRIQALIDGRWQDLKAVDGQYALPQIPKGFGAASGTRTVELRVSLGLDSEIKKRTTITLESQVALAKGNSSPLKHSAVQFVLAPITDDKSPAPTPSATPSTTPSATPSATPSVQPAVATGHTNLTTTTGSAGGALASTGSDSSTGLYAGLAATLVALGAAAAWLGRRRRGGASA
ncbi:LPXTG cell wall anchor domain-containing protein [Streptomyces sp. NPDC005409]|uniref:LPXTG cell wall anchor domain-containing protein n=1 Tax=Streptomyces sp. NPDC005409 TaxID=3155342 RepID=UPI00345720A2